MRVRRFTFTLFILSINNRAIFVLLVACYVVLFGWYRPTPQRVTRLPYSRTTKTSPKGRVRKHSLTR